VRTRLGFCLAGCVWAVAQAAAGQVPPAPQVVGLGVGLPTSQQAPQDILTLDLEEAVALALRDNRNVRAMRLRRVVERFDIFLVQRSYWPQGGVSLQGLRRRDADGQVRDEWSASPQLSWRSPVGTTVNASWSRYGEPSDGSVSAWHSDNYSLSVRQPLLKGAGLDANLAALRQSRRDARLQVLNEEAVLSDTVAQVVTAYHDLLQAQSMLALSHQSVERMQAMLANHEAMVEAGRMAPADLVQTRASLANMRLSVLDAERRLVSTRRGLLQLVALDPRLDVRVAPDVKVERITIDPDVAVETALAQRRDYLGHKLELERLEEERRIARRNRLWDVSLVAGYSRFEDSGLGFAIRDESRVGLQIDIPIADFSGRGAVLSADTSLHIAYLGHDEMRERIEGQVRDAVSNVDSMWRQLEAAEAALVLAKDSLSIQQERLQAGRSSTFEVLSLEGGVRMAEAQSLNARITYLNALTALDQQTGSTLRTWQISVQD